MHKFIYIQNYYSKCAYIYSYCSFANDFLILFFSHFVADLLPWFSLSLFKVLNLKGNSLSGQIPDLTSLLNLKSLFLINNNNFSKNFLDLISSLHRLKIVVLPRNQISSQIPTSLSNSSDCTHCICKTITWQVHFLRFTKPVSGSSMCPITISPVRSH